ncbi:MAG: N-6 DNA methylase [bacterium]
MLEALAPYGATADAVISLDGDLEPRARLAYGDLLRLPHPPCAVLRHDDAPLAYVLTGPVPPARVLQMRRLLAQRDEAPFLVILERGRLSIYAIDLDRRSAAEALIAAIEAHEDRASATLRRLHDELPQRTLAIHDLVHALVTNAIEGLHGIYGIPRGDAIALAGRALFMRFLVDRGVLNHHAVAHVCPPAADWTDLFATIDHLRATCHWIDRTFNGDFLSIPSLDDEKTFAELPAAAFGLLNAIMLRKARPVTGWEQLEFDLPPPEGWAELDFAQIPVGVLSQVYEYQVQRWSPTRKRGESVYYTPRTIAGYMVREAFDRLERQRGAPPHDIRVLDPAVGGGVFLVSAYRELCVAWYHEHGRWPRSKELRTSSIRSSPASTSSPTLSASLR